MPDRPTACRPARAAGRPLRGRPQHVRDRLEQPEPLLGHRFRAPVRQRQIEHGRPDAVNAAHRLPERPVGRAALILAGPAPPPAHAGRRRHPGRPPGKPRLASTRLPRNQQHPAGTLTSGTHRNVHSAAFSRTPHQRTSIVHPYNAPPRETQSCSPDTNSSACCAKPRSSLAGRAATPWAIPRLPSARSTLYAVPAASDSGVRDSTGSVRKHPPGHRTQGIPCTWARSDHPGLCP